MSVADTEVTATSHATPPPASPLQTLFDTLLQTYYAEAGLEAILLTDRDGVPMARSVVVHSMPIVRPAGTTTADNDAPDSVAAIPFVVQLLTEPAFLAVAPVVGDHAARLSLGTPRSALSFLAGYVVLQEWCSPLTLTLIADRSSPQFSASYLQRIGVELRRAVAPAAAALAARSRTVADKTDV